MDIVYFDNRFQSKCIAFILSIPHGSSNWPLNYIVFLATSSDCIVTSILYFYTALIATSCTPDDYSYVYRNL